ncbi:fungal-specific transcription factor domain-containing protein [Mycena amicta]|nr:fungal-specific transcription factor domain-containing protein [Mycena amicta]
MLLGISLLYVLCIPQINRLIPCSQWEQVAYEQKTNYVFPESDLVASLLALYFEEFHPTFPILHRPSFERSVAEGLHRQDPQFGATLLAVLATGARYSNDPRVFIDGHTQSSGWNFIKQVPFAPRWFEPNIYEVQFYFIMTLYFVGTSRPLVSWTYLGTGMRFLIQRGEHDRKRGQNTTQELELWNRAFWSFICLDRLVCGSIGRPVGLNPEDIDTDLPLDDESWDHDFLQPPTKHAYLICYVELCEVRRLEILASAMRRLYGSKKSKTMQGRDSPEWEQRVVSELESRMNKCFDSFPPHLRWDPDRVSTGASFDQSLVLHATYHWTRMIIYRPYIHKTSILAAPSLFICTSAARAVICAAHSWVKSGRSLLPQPVVVCFCFFLLVHY